METIEYSNKKAGKLREREEMETKRETPKTPENLGKAIKSRTNSYKSPKTSTKVKNIHKNSTTKKTPTKDEKKGKLEEEELKSKRE